MSGVPGIYRLPTYFHEGDSEVPMYTHEEGLLNLPIGTGVVLGDRYRVVDSWMSFDHHGVFDDGLHIFLERVTEDDDRLKRIAPSYFRD
jgi:hypothetical protein